MSQSDTLKKLVQLAGQSQDQRRAPELEGSYAPIDDNSGEDLLLLANRLAGMINFYGEKSDTPSGDWTPFFSSRDLAQARKLLRSGCGDVPPHLALFVAFLKLYKKPQAVLNQFTGRHLDFYYRQILKMDNHSATPDRVHLLLELKKKGEPVAVGPECRFLAGKDPSGKERLYAPLVQTVINGSSICSLRSIYVDGRDGGTIRHAPIADSTDGLGGKPADEVWSWSPFGHRDLPAAEVGFAVSSPVLRMKEGVRTIQVMTKVAGLPTKLDAAQLRGAFTIFLTGEKQWLGPFEGSPSLQGSQLVFSLTVTDPKAAIVDYDQGVHGYSYAAGAPVAQFLLNRSASYDTFRPITISSISVKVDVSGIVSLQLENDAGAVNGDKPFLPFGPQPAAGARFMVGCREALEKDLSRLDLHIEWKDVPDDLEAHYREYGVEGVSNTYFTASASFADEGAQTHSVGLKPLFEAKNTKRTTFSLIEAPKKIFKDISHRQQILALERAGTAWARRMAGKAILEMPVFAAAGSGPEPPHPRAGYITITLDRGFLHAEYRKKHAERIVAYTLSRKTKVPLVLPNEPCTPAIQRISLSYTATSDLVDLTVNSLEAYAGDDVRFYHLSCFGPMREHAFQRHQFKFLTDKTIFLLPQYSEGGQFIMGFAGLNPGDSVSVLFKVAEGSDDPNLPRGEIDWSVLCDNYWLPLGKNEVLLDSTDSFLTSGIIRFIIPLAATRDNTILPSGNIWIRGVVDAPGGFCKLVQVAANAVEAEWQITGTVADQSFMTLPPKTITALKTPLAEIKAVKQPYPSFGGRRAETTEEYYTRVAERLRHKNRCLTQWDYERVVLEAFPQLYRVKCIPHACKTSWQAPGNVLLVVIPRSRKGLTWQEALQPRVDSGTLDRIVDQVQSRASMQVTADAVNATFQEVKLYFKVAFRTGYEINYQSGVLNRDLARYLSPWAFDSEINPGFGGKIYKSVLLDFIEELEYVDYVTDFRMYSSKAEKGVPVDLNAVEPETPDCVLVSAREHQIEGIG